MLPTPTTRFAEHRARAAFTVLEIIVTLVIIGLAVAVVAPVFRHDARPNDDFPSILASARELAVRRSQTLVLNVNGGGTWRLVPAGDTSPVGSGTFRDGTRAVRVRVTPMGACFNEGGAPVTGLDAIACSMSGQGASTR